MHFGEIEAQRCNRLGRTPSPRWGEMLWGGDEGMPPSLLSTPWMEHAMHRNDLSRSLVAFDQNSTLVAVVELSLSSWLVAGLVPGLTRQPLKKQEADPNALLALLYRWRDEAAK